MASFVIYVNSGKFSKKTKDEHTKAGYVIVTDAKLQLSSRVVMTLLEESCGVPIIFAVVSPTAVVMLQVIRDGICFGISRF